MYNATAMYKGTTRTRTVQVYVDGSLVSTWTSSGTTDNFERIDVSSASGQVLEITGVLDDSEWLSIVEVSVLKKMRVFNSPFPQCKRIAQCVIDIQLTFQIPPCIFCGSQQTEIMVLP